MNSGVPLSDLKTRLLSEFKDFEARQNGATKTDVFALRRKAIDAFDTLGFPTVKNEEWKYTNLSKFISEDWDAKDIEKKESDQLKPLIDSLIPASFQSHSLVFFEGKFIEAFSNIITGENHSMVISSFSHALKNQTDLVNKHFGKAVEAEVNGMTALNTAYGTEGAFIHIPKGVKPEFPVHLIFIGGSEKA